MFGNNAFGALAVESDSAAAGPSRVSVEGPEVDADWIKLVRTNHDAVVRVSDKVDLSGLPYECSLMAVSNIWDLLLVGSNTGLQVYRLSELHRLLEGAAKDASPAASPVQTIPLPARPIWVKLAMNDERLVVSMADGAGTSLWRLRDVLAGSVRSTAWQLLTVDRPLPYFHVKCPITSDRRTAKPLSGRAV
ncbi:hypothetical protein BCR39DRAFT_342962 [Naematelia encephala]|uniref:Uncharacterized protein n=1 Tax=Naematelia encephala TaxID=71784 RepID=A0A1Y2APD8_9TREE|nr:hypothetical protein BCR39DRAFT_342962 [Naematelia encephala]